MTRVSVQLGLLAIAKDLTRPDRAELATAVERATGAGHRVMVQQIVHDDEDVIRSVLRSWIADKAIDAVIVLGGAASEAVSRAVKPLVAEVLPGFTDLFRWLMFQEAGATAMLASAEAARCGETFVFVLPGAIGVAMDKLILPQFDPATTPKNLLGDMPRLRELGAAPSTLSDEASTGHGVPKEVPFDKTQGGSGMPARLPAVPASQLARPRTGAHVIVRTDTTIDEPPTRPIDLAQLQSNIAASTVHEDVTRPVDLDTLLPADPKPKGPTKPPPGKKPASFLPSATGSFGLVDDDLEEVDTASEGADLDAIRAASVASSARPPTSPPPPPKPAGVLAGPPKKEPRTRPPTAAPKPAAPVTSAEPKRAPTVPPVAAEPKRAPTVPPIATEPKRAPTVPPKPKDVTPVVEPSGAMFEDLSKRKGMSGATKALLALLVLGGGAAAAVFAMSRSKPRDPTTAGSTVVVDAAPVAVAETAVDAAELVVDAADEPEIEIEPTHAPRRPVDRTRTTAARTPPPPGPVTDPSEGPATRPSTPPPPESAGSAGSAAAPPPAADGCDEAACVLSNYAEACCAKYKPSAGETFVKRTDGVPETLDKTMVRTAINGVKPKVQKCGEQTPVKGIVKVSLTVAPDGRVSSASLADAPDPTLGACVVGALKLARFDKTVSGASFTYPFQF